MAHYGLRAAAALLPLTVGACDGLPHKAARSSVTVKLPPARPAAPAPGFAFDRVGEAQ
jgi:hypothetical protein